MSSKKKETLLELKIGLTDYCNYQCIMCMQTAHKGIYGNPEIKVEPLHKDQKGYMSFELFEKIIDDISRIKYKFKSISLQWLGESMLHKDLLKMIEYILNKNEENTFFEELIFFTNASLLDEEKSERLSLLFEKYQRTTLIVVFSIDSASKETYLKIHNVDNFEKVNSNIVYFLNKTKRLKNIYRIYRFLVMPENSFEAEKFLNFWAGITLNEYQLTWNEEKNFDIEKARDIINFKRVYSDELLSVQRLHEEVIQRLGGEKSYFHSGDGERPPCAAPFRTPLVNWDGRLSVCYPDDRLELSLVTLEDNSFESLWFGDKAQKMRKDILNRDFDKYDRCQRCGNYGGFPLRQSEIKLYGFEIKS
ncbi:MAG: hypothetical protein C0601_12520 [Candidatus Muiribacterium halophilum]|uniref:Uncharacterized protein n=1 Tax=Muiribacterium halophilum TaxID=2053465 RepID=A0A2N5ZAB1_MUIH1|nr:MAG: hypothetical protein C0601_12520 [Candidatus Muirbacterium halophilum]